MNDETPLLLHPPLKLSMRPQLYLLYLVVAERPTGGEASADALSEVLTSDMFSLPPKSLAPRLMQWSMRFTRSCSR